MRTSAQPCGGSVSSNVWVAGMRSDTEYRLRAEWETGGKVKSGDWVQFHTGLARWRHCPRVHPYALRRRIGGFGSGAGV